MMACGDSRVDSSARVPQTLEPEIPNPRTNEASQSVSHPPPPSSSFSICSKPSEQFTITMSDYIPNEILFVIFQKLPPTSLIRCASVCKPWNSIIINPRFITYHLNRVNSPHQILNNEKILFRASVSDGREIGLYSLNSDNSCHNHLKLDRASTNFHNVEILGTCSGLVCLLLVLKNGSECDRVVIWNPYIRKAVSISCSHKSLQRRMLYGFFVHPTTHEYKVVAFPCRNNVNEAPRNVEVYRQREGAWNEIDSVVPYFITSSGATLNGVVHWLVTDRTDGRNSIVVFSMHTEEFSEMCVPPSLVHKSFLFLGLTFSSGSLVLYETCPERASHSSYSVLWVMKEYGVSESWCELFSIEIPGMWLTPMGLRLNGEVVLTTSTGKSLVCYDPVTNRTTTIAIDGIARSPADTYVESLLLLNVNGAIEHESFGEFTSTSM